MAEMMTGIGDGAQAGRGREAWLLMAGSVALASTHVVFAVLGRSAELPFFFVAAFWLGAWFGKGVWLFWRYRPILLSWSVWRALAGVRPWWLWALVGCDFRYFWLALAIALGSPALGVLCYEAGGVLGGVFLLGWWDRRMVQRGGRQQYGHGFRRYLPALLLGLVGVVLVAVSPEAALGSSWRATVGWSYLAGVGFAVLAGIGNAASMLSIVIGRELAAVAPDWVGRTGRREYLVDLSVFGSVAAWSAGGLLMLPAGLLLHGPFGLPALPGFNSLALAGSAVVRDAAVYGAGSGLLAGAASGFLFRRCNAITDNVAINGMIYLIPALAVVWLAALSGFYAGFAWSGLAAFAAVELGRLSYLLPGVALVVGCNALIGLDGAAWARRAWRWLRAAA